MRITSAEHCLQRPVHSCQPPRSITAGAPPVPEELAITENWSSSSALSQEAHLVNARRSLPIDNVNQVPRVPNEIHLQVAVLIDHELGCRVQDARALAPVRVVQVEFAGRQVGGGRSGVPVHLTESEEAVGDKANLPSSRGWNHSDVTAVVPQSTRLGPRPRKRPLPVSPCWRRCRWLRVHSSRATQNL